MGFPGRPDFRQLVATQHVNCKFCALQGGVAEAPSQGAEYPSSLLPVDPIPKPSVQKAMQKLREQGHFLGPYIQAGNGLLYPSEVERTVLALQWLRLNNPGRIGVGVCPLSMVFALLGRNAATSRHLPENQGSGGI